MATGAPSHSPMASGAPHSCMAGGTPSLSSMAAVFSTSGAMHVHKNCLTKADAMFNGQKLVIPPDVMVQLDMYQKVYLFTCLGVPFEALDVNI